jgi:pimeloyl-ACP methyl ester carboxylesterase
MPPIGSAVTSDAVIYLPGIMGSELVDNAGKVVWGIRPSLLARQLFFRDVMERLHVKPNDGISASKPVQLPVSLPLLSGIEPYTALEHRVRRVTVRPEAVRAFAYDWRLSIVDAAEQLALLAGRHIAGWRAQFMSLPEDERVGRPEPKLTLVGHSMGGLVASWFATMMRDQGGDEVRLVITLGTPFGGSLNALRVLSTGEQLPLGLFAASLRDAAHTMPGVYELLASYPCVDVGHDESGDILPHRTLTPSDVALVGGNAELTAEAQRTMRSLGEAIAADRTDRIRPLVGTIQPTLQSVTLPSGGVPRFAESIVDTNGLREDHRGDGTVFRYAAAPTSRSASYLPQAHGALAKSSEGIEFTAAVMTERPLGPFAAASDLGLRVPELAVAGKPFIVEAADAELGAMCQVHDVETDALVTILPFVEEDGRLVARIDPQAPGEYRISAAASGFSPVERLVLVGEPD